MKKVYITPKTEAIKLLGKNAIMSASPAGYIPIHGVGEGPGSGNMM